MCRLWRASSDNVEPDDIAATIVDLARRGHLRIDDRLRDGEGEWCVTRTGNAGDELEPFEERLIQGLVDHGDGDTVGLTDLDGCFEDDFNATAALLYHDAVERGWFVAAPNWVRRRFFVVAFFGTMVTATALIGAFETTTWALAFVPPFLASAFLLVFWARMPARGPADWDALGRIRGLRRYLATAEIDTMRFAQDEGTLLALLPYAMVLGLTDRWSRMLGDATGLLPKAPWFQPFVKAGGVR